MASNNFDPNQNNQQKRRSDYSHFKTHKKTPWATLEYSNRRLDPTHGWHRLWLSRL